MKQYRFGRKENESKNAIRDQLVYIKNSCSLFDQGYLAEAIRIAGALSVLLEKRRKTVGLLINKNFNFRLLSSVPDVQKIPIDNLIVKKCQDLLKIKVESDKNKYFLTYVADIKSWYLQAFDYRGNEVSCLIDDLPISLKKLGLVNENSYIPLPKYIKAYNENDNFNIQRKELIVNHLNFLLGHKKNLASGFYFPMVDKKNFYDHIPKLNKTSDIKYLDLSDWLSEIIFAIPDDKRQNHTLTRKELIDSARDQDGGGHFDVKLDVISYCLSKYGQVLAKDDDKEISTKNFHLIMLRQLGFEILNSQSIQDYLQENN